MTEAICDLLQVWPKNKELAEPPAVGRAGMMSTTISLSMPDMNRLNKLCAEYGMRGGRLIRALIRAYYAEHEQEIEAVTETPTEIKADPAEPTATQMPLPEPVEDDDKTAEIIATLKDDGQFRWMLLGVLGQIADGLALINEGRGADSAEIGKIANQLRTLNNAVWNR